MKSEKQRLSLDDAMPQVYEELRRLRLQGKMPLSPDTMLKKFIRPALVRAKVTGKMIGWHSFRHSLATNLRSLGIDVKVAQELLRHANSRVTMDIYTQAVSA